MRDIPAVWRRGAWGNPLCVSISEECHTIHGGTYAGFSNMRPHNPLRNLYRASQRRAIRNIGCRCIANSRRGAMALFGLAPFARPACLAQVSCFLVVFINLFSASFRYFQFRGLEHSSWPCRCRNPRAMAKRSCALSFLPRTGSSVQSST